MAAATFPDLPALAQHLRDELEEKKFVLIYAYNGTGKTRLSTAFKDIGKKVNENGEVSEHDTLYFNAFTEDLFQWDNDLDNDRERALKINRNSHFFDGLGELEMDNRIRPLLNRYADFDFRIDTTEWKVTFSRKTVRDGMEKTEEAIKVSRGEENIFIWCFFLAIVRLVLDEAEAYKWVRYIYVDDPISSLDDNNAVMVAHHLAELMTGANEQLRIVVSTHHVLFFNVLCNELRKARKYFVSTNAHGNEFLVQDTDSTPFLYHLASLIELNKALESGALYTYHFNVLRRIMEQTASFFGYANWGECIKAENSDPDRTLYKRVIDLMSHGDYSLYEPREMLQENKEIFGRVFRGFISNHPFSRTIIPEETTEKAAIEP